MAMSVLGSSLSSTVRTNEAGEPLAYVSNSFRFTDSENLTLKGTILLAIKRAGIDPLEPLLVPIDQIIQRSARAPRK